MRMRTMRSGQVQVADGDGEQQSWINVAVNSYLQD